ncbi:MAG: NADH:flavin oxidoreductase [Dehalococcoidia bacterium]|nr:MAG: NADH:flavin oxidoreductase [Dehalococcoidia bacterium]
MTQNQLFTPIRIGGLELVGRFVKSATTETLCTDDGFVTDDLIEYYEKIAQGGTPLLITGNAYFNLYSKGAPRQLAADNDDKILGLRRLTDAVHRHGSKIFMQIYHVGRQASPRLVGRTDAVSPSPVFEPTLGVRPRAITREEIEEAVQGLADAAARGQQAGFDGIQIHAAHGYLINAFLTPHTNRRKDEYGGSFENRLRFLLEVYGAIRQRVGQDYPVIMKINGSDELRLRKGLKPDDMVKVAQRMEAQGVDAVEISAGHYESGLTFERGHWRKFFSTVTTIGVGRNLPSYHRIPVRLLSPLLDWGLRRIASYSEGFNLRYSKLFKQALSIPVICVGGFVHREAMERAIVSRECDMVSVARALIADPFLYRHMQEGVQGPQCDFCNACYARAAAWPTDCYNDEVRAQRDRMLRTELG